MVHDLRLSGSAKPPTSRLRPGNPADSDWQLSDSSYDNSEGLVADTWRHVAFIEQGQERIEEAINILNSFKIIGPLECRQRLVALYRRGHKDDLAFSELIDLCQMHDEGDRKTEALSCLRSAL